MYIIYDRVYMVNAESLAIQENLENKGIQDILVNQENLVFQDDLVKMVLMETQNTVPSVLEYIQKKESLVIQGHQENVDHLDQQDPLENLERMPNAILESMVQMVNLEGQGGLEKMAYLENPAMMVLLDLKMI